MKNLLILGSNSSIGSQLINSNKLSKKFNIFSHSRFENNYNFKWDYNFNKINQQFISLKNNVDAILCLSGGKVIEKNFKEYKKIVSSVFELSDFLNSKSIYFMSSASVYGNFGKQKKETDDVNPLSNYSKSKIYMENIIREYARKKDNTIFILRMGNFFFCDEIYKNLLISFKENKNFVLQINDQGLTPMRSYTDSTFLNDLILKLMNLNTKQIKILNVATPDNNLRLSEVLNYYISKDSKLKKIKIIKENTFLNNFDLTLNTKELEIIINS